MLNKFNIKINEIKEKIQKISKKNNKKKIESRLLLSKIDQVKFRKKRKSININFSKSKINFLNQKRYIPYFLISIIVLILLTIITFLWPIFNIKYIEITKMDNITNMDIAYKSVEDFRWKNIFNIKEIDVFNKLKNYQDNIRSLDMTIKLPNTIKLEIWSFKEIYNVVINEKNYSILENWTLIPKNNFNEELKLINLKKDFKDNMFLEYRKILNPEYLSKITEIERLLKDNIVDIIIKDIVYYETQRELHITTENDVIIIFTLDWNINIEEQIKSLVIFNQEREQISKSSIVYIDLRVKNKIFFCPDENYNTCERNIKSIYSQ